MKTRIFTVLAVLIVLSVVAYLLKRIPEEAAKEPSRIPNIDWASIVDDGSEHLVIDIISPSADLVPHAEGIKLLEERFNVTFNLDAIHPTSWSRKKPLLLASGKIPDVFSDGGNQLRLDIKHDFIMPVPLEVIARYAPEHMRLVNHHAAYAWSAGMQDGINYAVPLLWMDSRYPRTGTWRMDWLRNVGIDKVPETLDEMEEALRRIRAEDPDGNGKKDTFGMTGDLESWYTMFTEIFCAFGILPYDFVLKDGDLVYGGIQPETKEALALLRRWYEEELIHPDFVTDKWYKEIPEKLYSGRIGYVNYFSSMETYDPHTATSAIRKIKQRIPEAELVPSVVPMGPRGERGHRVWGASGGGHGLWTAGCRQSAKSHPHAADSRGHGYRHGSLSSRAPGQTGQTLGLGGFDRPGWHRATGSLHDFRQTAR